MQFLVALVIPVKTVIIAGATALGLTFLGGAAAGGAATLAATNPEAVETLREAIVEGDASTLVEAISESQLAENYRENKAREAAKAATIERLEARVVDESKIVRNGNGTAVGCAEGYGAVMDLAVIAYMWDGTHHDWGIVECVPASSLVLVRAFSAVDPRVFDAVGPVTECYEYSVYSERLTEVPLGTGGYVGVYGSTVDGSRVDEWLGRAPIVRLPVEGGETALVAVCDFAE